MKDETGASAIDRGIAQDEMFLIQLNNMQQNKQSKIFEGENSSLKKTFDSAVEYGRVIEEVVEKGADLEHDRWSRWQKYLHSLCVKNEDGTLTIPKERVERWERQIATPYSELSEQEKEYDRIEVRKYQDIFNHIHYIGIKQGIEMVERVLPEERKVNYQSLSTGEIRNNVGFNTALSQIKDIIGELKKREHLDSLQTEISKYSIDGKDTILVNFSKGGQVIVSVDPIKTPINELITKLERL